MDDEDSRTIWCGNIHDKVTEDILYELFMQGGPVQKVSIPKDRDGKQKNFGFVTYKHVCSVPYALDLFDGTSLFNRTLNMKSRNNNLEKMQMQAQPPYLQMDMGMNEPYKIQSNELQLGQQVLLGGMTSINFAPNNACMLPGQLSYPSQASLYPHGGKMTSEYGRKNRHHNRNHPYNDHYENDRRNNRHDSYNRDQRSYKHSSHRSQRHDNRRNYR